MILEHVRSSNWNHVVSQDNPADLETRETDSWRVKRFVIMVAGTPLAMFSSIVLAQKQLNLWNVSGRNGICSFVARSSLKDIFDRFSSFARAVHIIAYILRFCSRANEEFRTSRENLKSFSVGHNSRLSHSELKRSRELIFRLSQSIYLSEEYSFLEQKKNIPNSSSILSLSPLFSPQRYYSC